MSLVAKFVDYFMGGIDFSNSEMGGEECFNIMTPSMRLLSGLVSFMVPSLIFMSVKGQLQLRFDFTSDKEDKYFSPARMVLLTVTCLIFGVQLGLKLMHRITIFLLCPCHVQIFTWIYLLASKPSQFHAKARELVHILSFGPTLAIIFPTDDWLVLPLEWEIFWIQHIFLAAMPFISMWIDKDIYKDYQKDILDCDWIKVSYFAWMMWLTQFCHFLSILTKGNVAHTLCSAYTDPFQGPYFVFAVIAHQGILIVLHSIVLRCFAKGLGMIKKANKGE